MDRITKKGFFECERVSPKKVRILFLVLRTNRSFFGESLRDTRISHTSKYFRDSQGTDKNTKKLE